MQCNMDSKDAYENIVNLDGVMDLLYKFLQVIYQTLIVVLTEVCIALAIQIL